MRMCALAAVIALIAGLPLRGQVEHSLLNADPLEPNSRLTLRLHAGDYQVRSSTDGRLHVLEARTDDNRNEPATDIRYRPSAGGARLEINPPSHKNGPHVTLALPACATLDVRLSAGELVFDAVPCQTTDVSLHAGEIVARIEDPESFHTIQASVTIGEIDAPGVGPANTDPSHGGFFRSFHRDGNGPRRFSAHVGTGQITLDARKQ